MSKPYQLFFLLLGVLIFAGPSVATADEVIAIPGQALDGSDFSSKASRLRVSGANDPDTVWIGHIADPTWVPKDKLGNPVPGVPAGGYGPFKVGRGQNLPGIGPGTHFNGIWDFDHFQSGELSSGGDSLMGWWPLALTYQAGGFFTADDKRRPFFGMDYGNQGNYVINQGSPKRTFGVTGYWHRDRGNQVTVLTDGTPLVPGPNPEWAPLGGTASAWCGLRVQGDNSFTDAITGNGYNSSVLQYNPNNSHNAIGSISTAGTDRNFPGYGSQWDQILYRDVTLAPGASLTISFKYVHGLSRVLGGNPAQRAGYFWKDPLKTVTANDGNFVSRTDAEPLGGGPTDSFTVYVGVPVEPVAGPFNDFVASDGSPREIYDPLRRWYSEVIRTNGPMVQVLSASGFSGNPAAGQPPQVVNFSTSIPNAGSLAAAISAGGGKVRIAFRVKTNRSNDDEDYGIAGFTSHTRGAAIIDDVVADGTTIGDFEAANAIDNDPATPATSAWKSTGKPPGVYAHVHTVDPAVVGAAEWRDPCSPPVYNNPSSPNRGCDMVGNVMTAGDHDAAEKPGGGFGSPDQDRGKMFCSPTINFMSTGPGDYNAMGIDADVANATSDYRFDFDHHTPGFRGSLNGNYFQYAVQLYPALQKNGAKIWGEARFPPFIFSWGSAACFKTATGGLRSLSLWFTSNTSGIPDSVRIYMNALSRCFTVAALTAATCSPATGANSGTHTDNIVFGIIDGAPPPGLSVSPWFFYQDAFPATSTTNFTAANFDTTSAHVKNALNRSLGTGLVRPAIPGDSAWIDAGGQAIRIDLIFRVLPGVGNYVQIGNRASALRKVPTSTTAAVGNAASTNFWESYMASSGTYGTGGGAGHDPDGPGPIVAGTRWDPNHWNSARCDTAETNLFPVAGQVVQPPNAASWMTMYHESDAKFTTLGTAKNRCFMVDPSAGRGTSCSSKNPTSVTQCNVICGTVPNAGSFDGTYPPIWTSDLNSGLPASENGLPPGRTYEFSKIIPDGQLTPGAHVQYFYRREPGTAGPLDVDLLPDTTTVNFGAAQADWSRWYHFSVLPDRWKEFAYGGAGGLCILVNDMGSRRQDEGFWVSVADSIGLTNPDKRGAHNGWTAAGGTNTPGTLDQFTLRASNGGQPGTMWDMWNGHAGESSTTGTSHLANRTAVAPGATELQAGKQSRTGPTADMLRFFYKEIVMLAADLTSVFIGPLPDLTQDDTGLLNDFANIPGGTSQPRSVYLIGSGFAEALTLNWSPPGGQTAFLNTYFGVNLTNRSYRTYSNNPKQVAAMDAVSGSAFDNAGASQQGFRFGVSDGCGIENDVLAVYTPVSTAAAQTMWENTGSFGPYPHSVFAPSGGTRLHSTYFDGSRISRIGSRSTVLPVDPAGRRVDVWKALSILSLGGAGCAMSPLPVGVGDGPGDNGTAFVNFLNLKSSNPMRSGESRIAFGLRSTERVEVRMYDVTGRLVKTVANRVFAGGQEHVVTWDGTDQAGNRVKSGVYFYQLKTPTWTSQKKLAVLAN